MGHCKTCKMTEVIYECHCIDQTRDNIFCVIRVEMKYWHRIRKHIEIAETLGKLALSRDIMRTALMKTHTTDHANSEVLVQSMCIRLF